MTTEPTKNSPKIKGAAPPDFVVFVVAPLINELISGSLCISLLDGGVGASKSAKKLKPPTTRADVNAEAIVAP